MEDLAVCDAPGSATSFDAIDVAAAGTMTS
jgi:hypothetical protein